MAATIQSFKVNGAGNRTRGTISQALPDMRQHSVTVVFENVDSIESSDQVDECRLALIAAKGVTCPWDTAIPLDSLTINQVYTDHNNTGKFVCEGVALYRRNFLSNGDLPAFEVGTESYAGKESDDLFINTSKAIIADGIALSTQPVRTTRAVSVYRIDIKTVLVDSPVPSTVDQYDGYVNTDAVTVLGKNRAPNTLRYDGSSSQVVFTQAPGTVTFSRTYHFRYKATDWSNYILQINSLGETINDPPWNGNRFLVQQLDPLFSTAFANLFPTHGGESAWGGTNNFGPVSTASWSRPT